MRHPLVLLVLGFCFSLAGAGWIPSAEAAPAPHHVSQGRAKKKPHKKKAPKPRTKKVVDKKPSKSTVGFEL
jgi:hypothetical protein